MQFKDIPGYKSVKTKLIQGVKQERVAHAQLFLGPLGSGSLPLALAYAQFVNCLEPLEDDSCGKCASCIKYEKLVHPDLHFSFPIKGAKLTSDDFLTTFREKIIENPYLSSSEWMDALENENSKPNIGVLECKNILRKLGFRPYESKVKVLIMWMPEYLGKEGNTLLKFIEEPKGNTLIIMAGSDESKLLGTIVSRVQITRIPLFADEDIAENLTKNFSISTPQAKQLAMLSQGSMHKAIGMIDFVENSYFQDFRAWLLDCYKGDMAKINEWVNKLSTFGRESLKSFMEYGIQIVRCCLIDEYELNAGRLTEKEEEFVKKLSDLLDLERTEHFYNLLNKAHYGIERNGNAKIMIFNLSLGIRTVPN